MGCHKKKSKHKSHTQKKKRWDNLIHDEIINSNSRIRYVELDEFSVL